MTEWLLVLIINSGDGTAITSIKVPDKASCVRAGQMHESIAKYSRIYQYECTEIIKEKKEK